MMFLWCDGGHDARENMRRDAHLLMSATVRREPVLRLFRFDPHGITLGHAQDPGQELDLEKCVRDDVSWAVRPTGGRAIFHAAEWTYSLAAPIGDPEWGGSLAEAYERCSRLVCASLVRLGVPAELARARGAGSRADSQPPQAVATPCFASTARHEITLSGRKLAGSAQRRTATALLQQGSVLLGEGHVRLVDYLRVPDERRPALAATLARAATHAASFVGSRAPLERWADALEALLPGALRMDGASGERLLEGAEFVLPGSR